jgi:hypothetical protein
MAKSGSQELYEKAEGERQRCVEWLRPYVRKNQPKFGQSRIARCGDTRTQVSKNSFDFAWTEVIERTRRYDGMCLCDSAQKLTASKTGNSGCAILRSDLSPRGSGIVGVILLGF